MLKESTEYHRIRHYHWTQDQILACWLICTYLSGVGFVCPHWWRPKPLAYPASSLGCPSGGGLGHSGTGKYLGVGGDHVLMSGVLHICMFLIISSWCVHVTVLFVCVYISEYVFLLVCVHGHSLVYRPESDKVALFLVCNICLCWNNENEWMAYFFFAVLLSTSEKGKGRKSWVMRGNCLKSI